MKNFLILIPFFLLPLISQSQHQNHPVDWLSWEEAVEATQEDPKPIFIDIYTQWCGPCKLLDKKTFHDKEVAAYLNENFHPVKMDAEMRDTIEFRGKTFKNTKPGFEKSSPRSRGKPHELPLSLVDGRLAYPALVILNKDMKRLEKALGYRGPDDMLKLLRGTTQPKEGGKQ